MQLKLTKMSTTLNQIGRTFCASHGGCLFLRQIGQISIHYGLPEHRNLNIHASLLIPIARFYSASITLHIHHLLGHRILALHNHLGHLFERGRTHLVQAAPIWLSGRHTFANHQQPVQGCQRPLWMSAQRFIWQQMDVQRLFLLHNHDNYCHPERDTILFGHISQRKLTIYKYKLNLELNTN